MIHSDRIRRLLSERGLSQSELARRVNVTQGAIAKLAGNNPGGSAHLHKIARELGTTPAYLTGETDDPSEGAPPPPLPPTIQFVTLPVAFPAQPALERMFEGLLRSMPDVGRDELPRELAMLLPSALARIQGPIRYELTDDDDDAAALPEAPRVAHPARRRASRT